MLLAWLHGTTTLLLLSVLVSAQNIFPSNSSGDLYPANSSPRFFLNGSEFHGVADVPLAPIGPYAQITYSDFVDISATGQLVNVGSSNANDPVSKYQFSYVSCDPSAYTGNLDASSVFDIVVNAPRASVIILYSETANHCTATDLAAVPSAIQSVLTTTDPHSAALLAKLNLNIGSPGVCVISPDLSSYTNNTSLPGGGAPGGGTTTAVAMIVLYSITGLITALFVVIVVTGTVRAHRHPERNPASTLSTPAAIPSECEHNADFTTASAPALALSTLPTPAPQASAAAASDNHPGCAICTEDFTQGEEMRVLPCNHKFHPDCIDPWLLNVSGTCPLCRIDLNPGSEAGSDGDGGNGNADLPPPIPRAIAMSDPATSSSDDGARRRDTITFAHLRSLASRNGSSSNAGAGAGAGALGVKDKKTQAIPKAKGLI
ncbi:hypothetical protein DV736_g5852, partial [Chaetothyriales sp. CBS 134916]